MNKLHIIKFTLCFLAAVLVGLFIWALNNHYSKDSSIRYMPDIQAMDMDGNEIVLKNKLDPSKRTAILFFHPDCEFCQQEIKGIINRNSECRDVQWVFFTMAQPEEISSFLEEYPLNDIPDSFLIREDWPNVYKQLSLSNPPELIVYDEQGKLMVHHKGATSIKTIVEELQ